MRLFKRTPKKCDVLSYVYNYLKPDRGIDIYLGIGEDKKLPGLARREIAYIHIKAEDIDKLIEDLRDIKKEYNVHGD